MLFCFSVSAFARGQYQSKEQFISLAFDGAVPQTKMLWLSADDKKNIAKILSHQYKRLRIRYWQLENEAVWILDEIGKEKPITIGVHIHEQKIQELKVLAFRESRGDEVRHEFFTKQFDAATLTDNNKLSRHIDGITGATLSVRALTKVARLALWLNAKVQLQGG